MIELRTLGTISLADADARDLGQVLTNPRRIALLAYLAAARPRTLHRRARLTAMLWPDLAEVRARAALRQELYLLRRGLGPGVIVGDGTDAVGVNGSLLWCDVAALEAELAGGRPAAALELCRGEFLPGLQAEGSELEQWLDEMRTWVHRRMMAACRDLAEAAEAGQDLAAAAAWARRLTELAPCEEAGWQRLIRLLDLSGDRAGALLAYESMSARLQQELEVEPSPETRMLVAKARLRGIGTEQDGALVPAAVGVRAPMTTNASGPALAVLPFVNLGADRDAYIAAGLHDELLTQLTRLGGLRVVPRTSVMRYRNTAGSLRSIAAELGVAAVVEGSVREAAGRVRVCMRLTDAATETPMWAATYDRILTVANLLDVQRDIARQITFSLRAELTPAEEDLLRSHPTTNLDAYRAYLRGRYFRHLPHHTDHNLQRALAELTRATQLDPRFAVAQAELAELCGEAVFFWTDASGERRKLARAAAQRAERLCPDSPRVRLSVALVHLRLDRDPERALPEIERAAEALPHEREVCAARSVAYALQGRFEDAIAQQLRVLRSSPGDAAVLTELAILHWLLRRFEVAQAYADDAITLAPDQLWPTLTKVLVTWSESGPTPETRTMVDGLAGDDSWVLWARYWQRMMAREYEEALAIVDASRVPWIRHKMWAQPRALLAAFGYRALGRDDPAAVRFEEARRLIETELPRHADDPRYSAALGLACAGLGQGARALRHAEHAVELLPLKRDALYALPYLCDLAAVHALLGESAAAARQLRELLRIPSWITPAWIAADFRFDSIRAAQEPPRSVMEPYML